MKVVKITCIVVATLIGLCFAILIFLSIMALLLAQVAQQSVGVVLACIIAMPPIVYWCIRDYNKKVALKQKEDSDAPTA